MITPIITAKTNYYYNKRNHNIAANVHFTGVPIEKVSPMTSYMEKMFTKFRQISKIRRYELEPELSKQAKIFQIKNGKTSFEVLDINPDNSKKYIIFFHGIGQNVTSNQQIYKTMINKGYGVLAPEYGGFGNSTGKISGNSIQKTVKMTMQYLQKSGIERRNIGVVGFSMGSYPSLELASKNKGLNFLVLISPFNSLKNELPVWKVPVPTLEYR